MSENMGLWSLTIQEDLKGLFYTYEVTVYGKTTEAVDPYARATGINGLRGVIIDLKDTNPEKWEKDVSPEIKSYTDAIIYETSVRDISMHPDSGIKNKGKYLGLIEEGTLSASNLSTGLDHILELGITHLQLMPLYDFSYKSVNEKNILEKYNWGYDPQNYNVPEGSYSLAPEDPIVRIMELKETIMKLHTKNIAINMDVVYNHMYEAGESNFEKVFPGYYFRINDSGNFINGSGCGNDTASENNMMKKFIVDSVLYWAEEYHIDGFRFDLMGLHDIETINEVRLKLDELKRPIMLYGEGWDIPTGIPSETRATQYNAWKQPKIGFFNDVIRDSVRGGVFDPSEKGFVSGSRGLENKIRLVITGCINYSEEISGLYPSPVHAINYVSAHDNHTLWDKLQACAGEFSIEERKSMQKLANAIVLTSQGIPFLHSGAEFCRTKDGVENSYNSPDNINWIDWERKSEFKDVFDYYKGLISLRKEHPAFRLKSSEEIKNHLKFIYGLPDNVVGFELRGTEVKDSWSTILVFYNGNNHKISFTLPKDNWKIAADKYNIYLNGIGNIENGNLDMEGTSLSILYKE